MKKKEIVILAVIAAVSFIALILLNNNKVKTGTATKEAAASATGEDIESFVSGSGVTVAVQHRDQVVLVFDPAVDAVYTIDGDVGGLQVEVKDGKWRVINEKCPNHVCAGMGWMGTSDVIPITCLPNNIMIFVEDQPE